MIIISVSGGLGNQMFEFAFYEKMKIMYPSEVIKLDIMHTFGHSHNGYEIKNVFGLEAPDCSLNEICQLSDFYPKDGPNYFMNYIYYGVKRKLGLRKDSCIIQIDNSQYYESYFNLNLDRSYYLCGVYANHKYFFDIREHILNIFTFPDFADETNIERKNKIENQFSVSIHFRRGDYLTNKDDVISNLYYRNAISYFEKKFGKNIEYYVFTDDPEYIKKEYNDINNFHVIEGNVGKTSFRDMQLMSLCKHNIIANSTFSFWGAFLNKNSNKVVVYPNKPLTNCNNAFACDEWIGL